MTYDKPITSIPSGESRKTAHNEHCHNMSYGWRFQYHATSIVRVYPHKKRIFLDVGGWNTRSTHNHISGIISRLRREFDWVPDAYTARARGFPKNEGYPILVLKELSPKPVFILRDCWSVQTHPYLGRHT